MMSYPTCQSTEVEQEKFRGIGVVDSLGREAIALEPKGQFHNNDWMLYLF